MCFPLEKEAFSQAQAFGAVFTTLLGVPASHIVVTMFKSQFFFQIQLSVNMASGRQQVMAQELGYLPPV